MPYTALFIYIKIVEYEKKVFESFWRKGHFSKCNHFYLRMPQVNNSNCFIFKFFVNDTAFVSQLVPRNQIKLR